MKIEHSFPIDDFKKHKLKGLSCWCEPEKHRDSKGNIIIIHIALGGSEFRLQEEK